MTLPAEIKSLLADYGRGVADVQQLSWQPAKAAYKIKFVDCSSAKARLHSNEMWADQFEIIRDIIGPHPGFAAKLMRRGRAVLEEWVPGPTLHPQPPPSDTLRSCGRLLANLHRVPIPGSLSTESGAEREIDQVIGQLKSLQNSGNLTCRERQSLVAVARSTAPGHATSGVIHFDFCGQNLVLHADRGPVCIDNETFRIGCFDLDLARTFYRWALSPSEQAAFLEGYVSGGGPAQTSHLNFWSLVSEVSSAFVRCRDGAHDADAPLKALRMRVCLGACSSSASTPADRRNPC
jgi:aminoglycoside phosphotransferase (APT) family kinase protein